MLSCLIAAVLLAPAATLAGGAGAAAVAGSTAPMAAELGRIGELIVGTFDTYEQTYWERVRGVPEALRHRRTTMIIRRVDLPRFGSDVYYAHKYWDGDPGNPAFRDLYVFHPEAGTDAVRLDLLMLPDPERFDDALRDPGVLSVLSPEGLAPVAMDRGCNTLWRLRGSQFLTTFAGRCLRAPSATHPPLILTAGTIVGPEGFFYLTTGVDAAGQHGFGPPDGVPSAELRARDFHCVIDRGTGTADTVSLHDQGDAVTLAATAAVPAVGIRLRQFKPPGSMRSQGLALIVLPADGLEAVDAQDRLISPHALVSPDATRIGYRSGDLAIHCDLARDHPGATG